MKRIICSILLCTIMLTFFTVTASASEADDSMVVVFDDGAYVITTIKEMDSRATGVKSGSKAYDYYSSDGRLLWSAVIFGNFTYTGATSSCSASNVSVTVYDDEWKIISKSGGRSGNAATGEVVMGRMILGVTVGKVTYNLSLICDANGNLS